MENENFEPLAPHMQIKHAAPQKPSSSNFTKLREKNQKKVEKFFIVKINQNEREFKSEYHNRKLFVKIFTEKWTGNAE